LQQEFQVACDMESKSFEASSTFTIFQKIKQWLDQKYNEFYIEKTSYKKLFDNIDLGNIQASFNEQECMKLFGIKLFSEIAKLPSF